MKRANERNRKETVMLTYEGYLSVNFPIRVNPRTERPTAIVLKFW